MICVEVQSEVEEEAREHVHRDWKEGRRGERTHLPSSKSLEFSGEGKRGRSAALLVLLKRKRSDIVIAVHKENDVELHEQIVYRRTGQT